MKISVVMATYNGETYIQKQLQSIYEQTRKPDEVVICDDCSRDKTAFLIQEFIENHRLKNWRLLINAENKGWQSNFLEALRQACGEYIFFSDQDDIWYQDKIEIMVKIMDEHPEIQCLAGKMVTIDGRGQVFEGRNIFFFFFWTGILSEHHFSVSFNTISLLGCCMCINRNLADIVLRMNINDYGHDAQCSRLGVLLDGAYTLDKAVICYRLHSGNTSGVTSDINFGSSNLKKRINDIEKNIVWLERLLDVSFEEDLIGKERADIIQDTIQFQQKRCKFLTSRNLIYFLQLFKYKRYYSGFSMYIGDFVYAFHINKVAGKVFWRIKNFKK